MKKISIVIPSYNKGKYLETTLRSITKQNYKPIEVIIQDGLSTDKSMSIIKKFAKKYKYIKWSSKKDKGQLDAINKGFGKASGDILTFINADDSYKQGTLKLVGREFSKHPDILWLAGRGDTVDENGNAKVSIVTAYKNFLLKINSYKLLLLVNYLMQPSIFISKEAYKKYGPFTGKNRYVLEYDLWLKIGKHSMPHVINKNLSSFRLIDGTFSTKMSREILSADTQIAQKYSNNILIIAIHRIHNFARLIISSSTS